MAGYYGTEAQQRLQAKSDRLTSWIMRTPGACLTGRLMCSDDPERLGWDVIHAHLAEDGAYSFRWVDETGLEAIRREVAGVSKSLFGWNGFCSAGETLRAAIAGPLGDPLPDGFTKEVVRGSAVRDLQEFLAAQDITLLSGAVMEGTICPARSILIRDGQGQPVSAGFVGMMQNAHSPLHDCAWAGLIASDPDQRGKGLGRRVTCELIRLALEDLGAARVMGFAAPDNLASQAMLQSCGLRPTGYASYVATLSDTRFTR